MVECLQRRHVIANSKMPFSNKPFSKCTMVEWCKRDSIKKKIGLGFPPSTC